MDKSVYPTITKLRHGLGKMTDNELALLLFPADKIFEMLSQLERKEAKPGQVRRLPPFNVTALPVLTNLGIYRIDNLLTVSHYISDWRINVFSAFTQYSESW